MVLGLTILTFKNKQKNCCLSLISNYFTEMFILIVGIIQSSNLHQELTDKNIFMKPNSLQRCVLLKILIYDIMYSVCYFKEQRNKYSANSVTNMMQSSAKIIS